MKWASALSVNADLDRAVDEIIESVRAEFEGSPPDLAVAFVSAEHSPASERLPGLLRKGLGGGIKGLKGGAGGLRNSLKMKMEMIKAKKESAVKAANESVVAKVKKKVI